MAVQNSTCGLMCFADEECVDNQVSLKLLCIVPMILHAFEADGTLLVWLVKITYRLCFKVLRSISYVVLGIIMIMLNFKLHQAHLRIFCI